MEKALELKLGGNRRVPWIEYNNAVDMFVQGLIEPDVVVEVDLSHVLRQTVKTQTSSNGELSHGIVA